MRKCTALIVKAALALIPLVCGGSLSAAPPPNGGTIAIELMVAEGDDDSSLHAFVDAASEALTARGFTTFEDPTHAAYVAELSVSRVRVGTGLAKDPHAESVSVGSGVVVPFSTGKSSVVALQRTKLEIRIRKRGEEGVVWDGVAVTVRAGGTPKGKDETVASDLSAALLHNYPAVPVDVIGVP